VTSTRNFNSSLFTEKKVLRMAKMRVYDLAKELQVQPKELLELLKTIGVTGKVPSSSIEDTAARSLRQMIENKNNPEAAAAAAAAPPPPPPTAFENFRATGRRAPATIDTKDVSSDVIEDYREHTAQDSGIITQGPAKSGPGARSDAGRYGGPRGADGAGSTPAPPHRAIRPLRPTRSVRQWHANGSSAHSTTTGASANGITPTNGASSPSAGTTAGAHFRWHSSSTPAAAPTPPPAGPPQRGGRFQGRGGRRDFRGGPRRDDRFRGATRFGDRNHEPAAPEPVEEDTGDKKLTLPPEITISELADKIRQPLRRSSRSCS
jgi:translation initiation factor IF-2